MEKTKQLAHLVAVEKRVRLSAPAFPACLITADRRWNDKQASRAQQRRQRLAGGAAALEAQVAQQFGEAGEVGVEFARREAGLRPIGLTVAGVKERLWRAVVKPLLSLDQV